jgi:beta-mannosidase
MFSKGANWIPPDMFMPRAKKNKDLYHNYITYAAEANYNTLRLWGGGQFEHDEYYEECDK